jgi:hypothetical protein
MSIRRAIGLSLSFAVLFVVTDSSVQNAPVAEASGCRGEESGSYVPSPSPCGAGATFSYTIFPINCPTPDCRFAVDVSGTGVPQYCSLYLEAACEVADLCNGGPYCDFDSGFVSAGGVSASILCACSCGTTNNAGWRAYIGGEQCYCNRSCSNYPVAYGGWWCPDC